jgi:hypothetical protein
MSKLILFSGIFLPQEPEQASIPEAVFFGRIPVIIYIYPEFKQNFDINLKLYQAER